MMLLLAVFAGFIFLVYSFYFVKIISAKPESFELELLKSLADWMISKGPSARGQLWAMLFFSVILEVAYFFLVFMVITHPLLIVFTGFFAGVEVVHLATVSLHFSRFFRGKLQLKQLFNWKIERISAMFFFTHTLLVLAAILFY